MLNSKNISAKNKDRDYESMLAECKYHNLEAIVKNAARYSIKELVSCHRAIVRRQEQGMASVLSDKIKQEMYTPPHMTLRATNGGYFDLDNKKILYKPLLREKLKQKVAEMGSFCSSKTLLSTANLLYNSDKLIALLDEVKPGVLEVLNKETINQPELWKDLNCYNLVSLAHLIGDVSSKKPSKNYSVSELALIAYVVITRLDEYDHLGLDAAIEMDLKKKSLHLGLKSGDLYPRYDSSTSYDTSFCQGLDDPFKEKLAETMLAARHQLNAIKSKLVPAFNTIRPGVTEEFIKLHSSKTDNYPIDFLNNLSHLIEKINTRLSLKLNEDESRILHSLLKGLVELKKSRQETLTMESDRIFGSPESMIRWREIISKSEHPNLAKLKPSSNKKDILITLKPSANKIEIQDVFYNSFLKPNTSSSSENNISLMNVHLSSDEKECLEILCNGFDRLKKVSQERFDDQCIEQSRKSYKGNVSREIDHYVLSYKELYKDGLYQNGSLALKTNYRRTYDNQKTLDFESGLLEKIYKDALEYEKYADSASNGVVKILSNYIMNIYKKSVHLYRSMESYFLSKPITETDKANSCSKLNNEVRFFLSQHVKIKKNIGNLLNHASYLGDPSPCSG